MAKKQYSMNYVESNQEILNRWLKKFCEDKSKEPDYNGYDPAKYFAEDGIMYRGEPKYLPQEHEDGNTTYRWVHASSGHENALWEAAPLRILYLTKDQNTSGSETWDVRSESYRYLAPNASEEDLSAVLFHVNLVYSLYGLLKTTPERMMGYEDFTNAEALKLSEEAIYARINCRKEYGLESCSDAKLEEAINAYKGFLREQICNLDADLFICCGSHNDNNIILNALNEFYDNKFKWIGYATWYNEEDNKLAIDSYHLSYVAGGYQGRYEDIVTPYFEFLKEHPGFLKHR